MLRGARAAEASKEIEKEEEEQGDAEKRCAPASFFSLPPLIFFGFFICIINRQ